MTLTLPQPHSRSTPGAGPPPGDVLPRLLSAPASPSRAGHVAHFGEMAFPPDLIAEVRRAGLRGRGGAAFPTAVKMDAVAAAASHGRRRPVVVANGTESEPVSAKDRTLLAVQPHLVLDGMEAAAHAVGATRALLCVKDRPGVHHADLDRALAERPVGPATIEVVRMPARYLSGEETALINWIDHRRALPTLSRPRPAERGVGRQPTLVDNVETLANLALIARYGAPWWASIGTDGDPGTMLVTVSGAVRRPGVREVAMGAALTSVLRDAGADRGPGVLVGGYFGTWLTPGQVASARLSGAGLAPFGAGVGCGALVVLPDDVCPLVEVARVAGWLAGQSAGQCGPCRHGLPAIAGALGELATGAGGTPAAEDTRRWSAMVRGRGACKLPDGAAQFVVSALEAFGPHVEQHHRYGPCAAVGARPVLPTPAWEGRP